MTNQDWNLQVQKIFHIYWGGDVLPYIRYMTVRSFMQHNPDWKVMLWMPTHPFKGRTWDTKELNYEVSCTDYTDKLKELPITVTEVDFTSFGFPPDMAENFKSDFMHYFLLHEYGGVCSDMDIVYFKPITNLSVNTIPNHNKEVFVCMGSYGHSNGFLMGVQGNAFYKSLTDYCLGDFVPNSYQSLGPGLVNKYYPTLEKINDISPVANIGMDAVYSHDAFHVTELLDGSQPRFTTNSIGVHWYAGHPLWGKFMRDTNGGVSNLGNNIIGNILRINKVDEKQ